MAALFAVSGCGAPARPIPAEPADPASYQVDHVVRSTPENLSWGWFPIDKEPVVVTQPGEVVEIHTLSGAGSDATEDPIAVLGGLGVPAEEVPEDLVAFWKTRQDRPREGRDRHLITGPVYIAGAEPGDLLEVQILDVRPRVPWGMNFTRARSGVFATDYPGYRDGDPPLEIPPETPDLPPEEFHLIRTREIEGRLFGIWDSGIRVPLAPFMGIYAVAPDPTPGTFGVDVPGVRRSAPPGPFGGNLDLKHLTAGATLFLPVFHSGARFYVGDPHAAQGDGEVSGTAIEQSMIGVFRFLVHKGGATRMPRGETPTHHLVLGMDTDLDRALRNATYEVVDYLVTTQALRPSEAFSLASAAVDFTITEAVDEVQVVTALIPKSILRSPTVAR
ncbi:MAG: acetamidase/formamidase family protein [Gemmatimonadales bacterium]